MPIINGVDAEYLSYHEQLTLLKENQLPEKEPCCAEMTGQPCFCECLKKKEQDPWVA